jgi:hypothetical protein
MPRAAKRRIDPDAVYEAWTSVALDVPNTVISRGTRLRGSAAAVQSAPWAFVTAGTQQHEWPSELGTTEAPEPTPDPSCDIELTVEPRELHVVEATRDIRVLIAAGAVNLNGGLPGRLITYPKGAKFKADSEVVLRLPDNFFKAV